MDEWGKMLLAAISANPGLAALVVGLTSFGESFPVISLFVPGGVVLIGAGALMLTGSVDPVSILAAALLGTAAGDAAAYWLGRKFGETLPRRWPLRKNPGMFERGSEFFLRYGHASVFIGRFFGPLRTVIPLTAGVTRMHFGEFMLSTVLSGAIYLPALMFSGYLLNFVISSGYGWGVKAAVILAAGAVLFAAVHLMRRLFHVS